MKKYLLSLLFIVFPASLISYAQTIEPKCKDGGLYYFQIGNVYFEICPRYAGRVSSLKLDGKEIMYVDWSNKKDIFGSTLWPSPQSFWQWPPLVELSDNPYTGGIEENKVVLQSNRNPLTGLIFKKTFYADLADTSITLIYEMNNTKNVSVTFSAWELTRVPAGGIIFFPNGAEKISGALSVYFKDINNLSWFQFNKSQKGDKKLFSDGSEGWSGYVNDSHALLVKTFDDLNISQQAPGEKEIEYWLTVDHHFIELENQGPYTEIRPNASVEWKIKWYVRNVPESTRIEIGNEKLVELARQLKHVSQTQP